MANSQIELQKKVDSAASFLLQEKGYVSAVDVLQKIGVLSKVDYENWRFARVDYLERVCKISRKELSVINNEIRAYARKHELKPSFTDYRKWGKGGNIRLRFSKSGENNIEKSYATHYLSSQKVTRNTDGKDE